MPFHVNSIGAYEFEDLRGRLQPKAEQLEVIVRPGHAGETTRRTGVRAAPSQLLSVHYVQDWTAAKNALVAYGGLIGVAPVEVVQHSLSYGYFKVLAVTEAEARAVVNVGGDILVPGSTVLHVVQWTLLSTLPPA